MFFVGIVDRFGNAHFYSNSSLSFLTLHKDYGI